MLVSKHPVGELYDYTYKCDDVIIGFVETQISYN
jgi:hypothetical protein